FSSTDPQDNAQHVLKDRKPFNDVVPDSMGYGKSASDYKGPNASYEATGDALVAAATGVDPDDRSARPVEHTGQHRQVLDSSLKYLAQRGDDFPAELRDDMAIVLTNHGDVAHHSASALADDPEDAKLLDRDQLLEVSKQISRDQNAYGMLNEGLNREIVRDIHEDNPKDPKETLLRAGNTVGFLEQARYQALETDKDDPSWDAKWLYHGFGSIVNFAPGVGDLAQRGIDAVAYEWQTQEQKRIDAIHVQDNKEVFKGREQQLQALADEWAKANPRPDHPAVVHDDHLGVGAQHHPGAAEVVGLRGPDRAVVAVVDDQVAVRLEDRAVVLAEGHGGPDGLVLLVVDDEVAVLLHRHADAVRGPGLADADGAGRGDRQGAPVRLRGRLGLG
ncbi:hypothetical protein ABZ943_42465, partial [Streptomyces rubiginosohelvolus]